MIPIPLEAVIFDMDGVLLDTETLQRAASIEACAAVGYEMTDSMFHDLIGHPVEIINVQLASYFGPHFPLEDFNLRRRALFDALCAPTIALKAGAVELLDFLVHHDIPRAVATSTGRSKAKEQLDRAGLLARLDALVTRDDVARGKPHPDCYLEAARQLGVEPAACLALEDSYNGVRAAHAAGMATVMVPDILAPKPEIANLCIAVLDSLAEVRIAISRGLAAGL